MAAGPFRAIALLAAVVGLSTFPLLLVPNAGLLLRLPLLATLWVGFALVNGTIQDIFLAITGILTLLFLNTRTLRLPTATHILSDLGNLNIFVFMGLASAL